jgi:hypothetical protein
MAACPAAAQAAAAVAAAGAAACLTGTSQPVAVVTRLEVDTCWSGPCLQAREAHASSPKVAQARGAVLSKSRQLAAKARLPAQGAVLASQHCSAGCALPSARQQIRLQHSSVISPVDRGLASP